MSGAALELQFSDEALDELADRLADRLAGRLASAGGGEDDPWMNADQAAEHLAAKRHRIYDLVSEGKLQCKRDGSRLLFRRSWLDTYLEAAG